MLGISKRIAALGALIAVTPALISFAIRSQVMGADRALEGSTQALGLIPGILGQYLRRAFLARVLAECHATSTVEFGTIFSQTGARIGEKAYVGPRCHLGLVHVGRDVMLAAGVHVPSGGRTHSSRTDESLRDQAIHRTVVSIGDGSWIGSAAVVMADVGPNTIVGAGAVVTEPLPANVVAVGVPARVVKQR